jgi:Fic family protein
MSGYRPPLTITPAMLDSVEQIGEALGRCVATTATEFSPQLRRANRIRTIQASLAIENNTLNLEQVTAFLPVETVIKEQQDHYYQALASADQVAEATPFVSFMLQALLTAPSTKWR